MIKRFIKQKGMTVTQAINRYGESCNVIRTRIFEECYWQSTQHFRLHMSVQYQEYLQMSDAHLAQVHIELEKGLNGERNVEHVPTENFGVALLEKSIVPCDHIRGRYGNLEHCIPIPNNDIFRLANDVITYGGEFQWWKKHHLLIPFGKLLYSDFIAKMEQVFRGRIPGRHAWHSNKKIGS